jgi:CheY-like chemotaxis protein
MRHYRILAWIEAARVGTRADEALASVFLVALTGCGLPEDRQRAEAAGFDRHLAKPPGLEQLKEVLGSLGQVRRAAVGREKAFSSTPILSANAAKSARYPPGE